MPESEQYRELVRTVLLDMQTSFAKALVAGEVFDIEQFLRDYLIAYTFKVDDEDEKEDDDA
jgi:hypothetical protein